MGDGQDQCWLLHKPQDMVIASRHYQRKDGISEEQQKHNQFLASTPALGSSPTI